jgi:hypothetical protein
MAEGGLHIRSVPTEIWQSIIYYEVVCVETGTATPKQPRWHLFPTNL